MPAHGFAELLRVFHGFADIGEHKIVMSFIFNGFFRNKDVVRDVCLIDYGCIMGIVRRMYDFCC